MHTRKQRTRASKRRIHSNTRQIWQNNQLSSLFLLSLLKLKSKVSSMCSVRLGNEIHLTLSPRDRFWMKSQSMNFKNKSMVKKVLVIVRASLFTPKTLNWNTNRKARPSRKRVATPNSLRFQLDMKLKHLKRTTWRWHETLKIWLI